MSTNWRTPKSEKLLALEMLMREQIEEIRALRPHQTAHGEFWVIDAPIGPFRSHEEAWRWIDQHTDEGRADTDRYNRIRIAFSGAQNSAEGGKRAGVPAKR
jgi:hypothetical protein